MNIEDQEMQGWYTLKQKKQMQEFRASLKQPDIQPRNMSLKNKQILTAKKKFTPTEQKKQKKKQPTGHRLQ